MKLFTSILMLLIVSFAGAQEKGAIQGTVLDVEANNEPLAFAKIYVKDSKANSSTDLYGTYYMNLEPGTYTLVFGFFGYQKVEVPNIIVKAGEVTTLENTILVALQIPTNLEVSKKSILKETTASLYNN